MVNYVTESPPFGGYHQGMWLPKTAMPVLLALCCSCLATCMRHHREPFHPTVPPGPVYTMTDEARTVSAGAVISITSIDAITASGPSVNRYYEAVIRRDVLNRSGFVLIPNGSPAALVVLAGPRELELALHSVMVAGDVYLTGPPAAGSSPAAAPLGTLIEALVAPAGKAPVSVGGSRIHVPSGALLTFALDQPFRLVVSGGVRPSPGSAPAGF